MRLARRRSVWPCAGMGARTARRAIPCPGATTHLPVIRAQRNGHGHRSEILTGGTPVAHWSCAHSMRPPFGMRAWKPALPGKPPPAGRRWHIGAARGTCAVREHRIPFSISVFDPARRPAPFEVVALQSMSVRSFQHPRVAPRSARGAAPLQKGGGLRRWRASGCIAAMDSMAECLRIPTGGLAYLGQRDRFRFPPLPIPVWPRARRKAFLSLGRSSSSRAV